MSGEYQVPVLVMVTVPADQARDQGDADHRALQALDVLAQGPITVGRVTTVGRALRDGVLGIAVRS